jgi:3-oxoadipate enol-lactonase
MRSSPPLASLSKQSQLAKDNPMPFATLPDVTIHYALTGNPSNPPLILSNSLGADFSMWDATAPAFEKQFYLLRYDMRGHGKSSVPAPPYSVTQLATDLLALADSLGFAQFLLCGLSVGGMIGMHLALHLPARLKKLVLCNTAAKIGTNEMWNTRIETVRGKGMSAVAQLTPARWFTPSFQSNHPEKVAASLRVVEALNPEGYIGGCCAVRDFDFRAEVSRIDLPTLVVSGTHDPAATPADGRFLTEQISGARYVELNTSHISSVEDPSGLTAAVLSFLAE